MKPIVFGAPEPTPDLEQAVIGVLRSGWWGAGSVSEEVERRLEQLTGAKYAVLVSSGTAALHSILAAAGISPGDEVVTTPMTYAATAHAIELCGARPVFAEIDPLTGALDPRAAESKIGPRTTAILPVHLYGRPCNMEAFREIADRKKILFVEDAAHALGASIRGIQAGTVGIAGALSFNYQKNVAAAEGGAVLTNESKIAVRARQFAHQGESKTTYERYKDHVSSQVVMLGANYRPTDIGAAMIKVGLSRFTQIQGGRLRAWDAYQEHLADLPVVRPLPIGPKIMHGVHLYQIRVPVPREELREALQSQGIGTGVHYRALHLEPYYRERYGHREGEFPLAEEFGKTTLSLPLSSSMTEEDVVRVAGALRRLI